MIALLAACHPETSGDSGTSTGPRAEAELLDMFAWEPGDATVQPDPLADERPAYADCPEGGAFMEGASFEINTGLCTWGWFQQPALVDLVPGDVVEVVFWHAILVSDEPAQGHLALWVGDHPLFDRVVDIPHDPEAYTESATVDFSSDAGDVVTYHVDNHGTNTWNLLRVTRQGS